jgi:crossover junction endodeoxyribonuclease RuvC
MCLLCAQRKVKLVEHSVKRIRKALLGNGNASKEQARDVVAHILKFDPGQVTLDASDALALALGYAHLDRY